MSTITTVELQKLLDDLTDAYYDRMLREPRLPEHASVEEWDSIVKAHTRNMSEYYRLEHKYTQLQETLAEAIPAIDVWFAVKNGAVAKKLTLYGPHKHAIVYLKGEWPPTITPSQAIENFKMTFS